MPMDDRHDTRSTTPATSTSSPTPGWSTTSSAASCRRNGSAGSTPAPSNAATAAPRRGPAGGALIWRLRWQGGSDWVYLLLKPQSEPDPCIALGLELDRGLLYRALLRRRRGVAALRLPAVLPVVLYSGEQPLERSARRPRAVPAARPRPPAVRPLDALPAARRRERPAPRHGGEGQPRLAPLRASSAAGRPRPSTPSWNGWPRCSPWRGTIRCAGPGAAFSAARSCPAGSPTSSRPPARRVC